MRRVVAGAALALALAGCGSGGGSTPGPRVLSEQLAASDAFSTSAGTVYAESFTFIAPGGLQTVSITAPAITGATVTAGSANDPSSHTSLGSTTVSPGGLSQAITWQAVQGQQYSLTVSALAPETYAVTIPAGVANFERLTPFTPAG